MKCNKYLLIFMPGLKWLSNYTIRDAVADLIAGITVGLTVLPQSLAYAALAGLPPQYGLYSAFVGGIVYAALGNVRQVTIGPTALLSLMTSKYTSFGGQSGPAYATLLCFVSGIVELLMAFLKLGVLVDLISLPVTVSFTSATALIIGFSQFKSLLGLKGSSGSGFLETIKFVFSNLSEIRVMDMGLGFASIAILLLLRKLKDVKIKKIKGYRTINGIIWAIATSRNALIVTFTSLLAYYLQNEHGNPFILTGSIFGGFPEIKLPDFQTEIITSRNVTITQPFIGMIQELGMSIVTIPLIAILGNVAISKAFGGVGFDASKELIALSLSNIFGAFVCSMPVTGSFSRSAVNHSSGVRTPIGGIYTSILVLLAVSVLTPYFQYIPKAALSAVIISAVIFMIEYEVIRPLWKCSRRELFPGAVTFILSLWQGVEIGLLMGVLTDLAFLVHRAARPSLYVEKNKIDTCEFVLIKLKYSLLYFPAIEWVCSGIANSIKKFGPLPIVLDCRTLNELDFTAARRVIALDRELNKIDVDFYLLGPTQRTIYMLKEASQYSIKIVETQEDLEYVLSNRTCACNDEIMHLMH